MKSFSKFKYLMYGNYKRNCNIKSYSKINYFNDGFYRNKINYTWNVQKHRRTLKTGGKIRNINKSYLYFFNQRKII